MSNVKKIGKKTRDNTVVFSQYKVPKAVATLALPSMVGMLFNIVYNLADTFFVGQTGDANQVAAVSVSMPVFLLFMAVGNLFGVGGCAFISRSLGEGKVDKIKSISSFAIYGGLAVCVVVGTLFIAFREPLLYLVGASENTIDSACDYLLWVTLGAPFTVFAITCNNLIRGEGAAKVSMVGSVLGQLTNIILDPIFILGAGDTLFGFELPFGFDMGVAGAAIATVLGNVVNCIYLLSYFLRGKSILSITPARFSFKGGIPKGVVSVGLPAALTNLLMSFSNILVNSFLSKYGDDAVAAMGITMKANMLVTMLQIGLAIGIQPLVGYCYGAKNYKRMKSVVKFSIVCNVIIGASVTVFYLFFREQVIGLFIQDEQVIAYGVKMLFALMSPGAVLGIMFVINNAFQGMGRGVQSLILAVARQGLVFLPTLIIMDKLVGLTGLIWAQPTADFCCVVMAVIMFSVTMKQLNKKESNLKKD